MNTKKNPDECIGIICGSGCYPRLVAQACAAKGVEFCLLFLKGCASDLKSETSGFCSQEMFSANSAVPSLSVGLGEIAKALDFFHRNGVTEIIFAGSVKRPNFHEISLDKKGASWLLKLGKTIFAGDDALLKKISELLEQEGFKIRAGTDLLGDVFVQNEVLSFRRPSESDYADIGRGLEVARAIGNLDIGQAVIVCDGLVLGVECVEGTDVLIERCAPLRKTGTGGILVKASKPQQDYRLDLPTIGPKTIVALGRHHFSGVAVEAGKCIVIDKKSVIEQINNYSMFFYGCTAALL
ncbi:MAG: UDP-2,3-diacylglucosamine diphosphatase LpxI [Holosporaceae bacterium]|nr:UDP-2,3-diacylglucosamine diphosphatase LpxI [Holosporaceae bacterium]